MWALVHIFSFLVHICEKLTQNLRPHFKINVDETWTGKQNYNKKWLPKKPLNMDYILI